ncbi:symplekin [Exaiptasia diaphana]|uniref:Symplekin n=1 Tax=Exaiptasia diaphana TaxID=2652724 RepID=A0A913WNZ0_EXADI|nr:symplekin [Exaiptasia diaphana]KXJ19127.1 Symplekin [Exaiptasia diaphana]
MAAGVRGEVKNLTRLSEASQFFSHEETGEAETTDVPVEVTTEDSTTDKVIDLLNQAQLEKEGKLNCLKQVQEFIVQKDPSLLDNFLDEILVFQQDKSADVRKFVVGFVEEACKKDVELLGKVLGNLVFMLNDENVAVQKRVMLCFTQLYKYALQYICKKRVISEELENMWEVLTEIKNQIISMLDSDNDGIRTHAIKFMEMLVLVQSNKTQDSESTKKGETDISLDVIPRNHPLVRMAELREEGGTTLEALLTLIASPTISSVNLMACLGTLSNIARQRPIFMSTVVQTFESLHANLPTSLSKSQVSSVRKNLKLHLMNLLRHPCSIEFLPQITTLLTDLGASQTELQKNMPKTTSESMKRRAENEASSGNKKSKLTDADDPDVISMSTAEAIDVTAQDLIPLLDKDNVTNLVLISMLSLPDHIPTNFSDTYTPIAAAGGQAQVAHLARLLASQMTAAGVGVGFERMDALKKAQDPRVRLKGQNESNQSIPVIGSSWSADADAEFSGEKKDSALQRILSGQIDVSKDKVKPEGKKTFQHKEAPIPPLRMRRIKAFKLAEVTKDMNHTEQQNMLMSTIDRIIKAENSATRSGVTQERIKLLVGLAIQCEDPARQELHNYIQEDPRAHYDLIHTWLYQEYLMQEVKMEEGFPVDMMSYDHCLCTILEGLQHRMDPKDKLFTRVVLEAPLVTERVMEMVKLHCENIETLHVGFATLRDLILKRPASQHEHLQTLLELTTNEKEQVRVQAIHSAKKLHTRPDLALDIETFALSSLELLIQEKQPSEPDEEPKEWTDESIKTCLYLYLALLPQNHKLFHQLAIIYTASSQMIKRIILRHLETPVRAIGMASPELLQLVESCPTGSETLIARILNIITDKAAPSPDLVKRVKDLYHKRVADVRFLIPVLTGLEKQEIIAVLPKLIKQSPSVVKEVFNRLLGCFHSEGKVSGTSPLSPSELLVALHMIEPSKKANTLESKGDIRSVMKAIRFCFDEKTIYTQEVLAIVLQQLMEINPLPTLFMRTVIQSLSICPRLIGFVMSLLSKLITKQVWKQPKVWQGFVKCCQMTKPQSFSVLLQLPPRQLESAFEICPELRDNVVNHVQSFTPHQRAHIPRSVLQILDKEKKTETDQADKEQVDPKQETESKTEEIPSSPKRSRSSSKERRKDRKRSRRSRSGSPHSKREHTEEGSESEGEIEDTESDTLHVK